MSNEIPFWMEKLLEMAKENGIKTSDVDKVGCNKLKNTIKKSFV